MLQIEKKENNIHLDSYIYYIMNVVLGPYIPAYVRKLNDVQK